MAHRAVLHRRMLMAVVVSASLVVSSGSWATGMEASGASVAGTRVSTLVDIRAAHHSGYDRIVFEFKGPPPDVATVRWVKDLRLDPSDLPARVQGNAFLRVRFEPAVAHQQQPPSGSTLRPARRAYALPNVAQVVLLGDYEADVSVGIGLMRQARILRSMRLTKPSRFVVDVSTAFARVPAKVYFVDRSAVARSDPPYVVAVTREVPSQRRTESALLRLYAGPTQVERRRGLRFVASGTTGFEHVQISERAAARVVLLGTCRTNVSVGKDVTVASQIRPTLLSRPGIRWLSLYVRYASTAYPWRHRDAIPACPEP